MAAPGILHHLRNYASAGMLSALAGVISFPILTRNLSVEDYGILGLITSSLTLFIAIGKLGMQHAVIRFFAQIRNGKSVFGLDEINSTVSFVFLLLAAGTTVLWLSAGFFILPRFLQHDAIATLFLIAAGIVFVRLLGSGFMNFLRAQQRSGEVALTLIMARYLNLSLILLLLFFSEIDPYFLLACLLFAEIAGVGYAASRYWPDFRFRWQAVSGRLARAMLIYGLPLMILESLGLVLRLSDRYLIEAMLGVNELGMYSASYNLTAYLDIIVLAGLVQAVKPMYMHLWESSSPKATQDFLSRGLHFYVVLGLPVVAVFSLVSPHMLNILASPKYAPGTVIIPFVAFSFLLDGSIHFLAAGLYIRKNTKVLMFWGMTATIINLVLNVLLIPTYGIVGAAAVTIVSYAVFVVGVTMHAFRFLAIPVKPLSLVLVAILSSSVYLVFNQLDFGGDMPDMIAKGVLAGLVLLAGLLMLDAQVREWCMQRFGRQGAAGGME